MLGVITTFTGLMGLFLPNHTNEMDSFPFMYNSMKEMVVLIKPTIDAKLVTRLVP